MTLLGLGLVILAGIVAAELGWTLWDALAERRRGPAPSGEVGEPELVRYDLDQLHREAQRVLEGAE